MAQSKLKTVSAEILFQGSWYALEQCRRLLLSASLVSKNEDQSTAVALSMFAREELGKSRILRDLAQKAKDGSQFTPKQVQSACEDHVKKQSAGALSTTLLTEPSSKLDDAQRNLLWKDSDPQKMEQASQMLDSALKHKKSRQPKERQNLRERALYVDLNETGTGWHRPVTLKSTECQEMINDARNDYLGELDRLRDEVIGQDYPDMAIARSNMSTDINLPGPFEI